MVSYHPAKFGSHRDSGNGFGLSRDLIRPLDQRVE